MKEFINTCWFAFKWGFLAAMVAAVGLGFYFYSRVNEEIRQRVQAKWQEHYKDFVVTVRSAQLVEGEGIEIRGLTILDPRATGPRAELAYLDEMVLYCETGLTDLLDGEPEFSRVLVRRPTIHATRRADGTWSAARLLPIPRFSKHPHQVAIEDGTIEFFDPLRNPSSTLTLRDINLQSKPLPPEPDGDWGAEMRGYLTGDHFQRLEVSGSVGPNFKSFDLNGSLAGLEISPDLRDVLPADTAQQLVGLAPLRGQARVDFRLRDNPATPGGMLFQAKGQLAGGQFDDPRLPYPLTDLKIDFRADNQGLIIDDLKARSGQANLRLAGQMQGFHAGAPLSLQAHAEHLLIGPQWEATLPEPLLSEWRKFLPSGEIDADLRLVFDGRTWRPDLTVRCLNVAFTYHKFPYRFDHAAGLLVLKDDHVTVQMTARAGGQPIAVSGQFDHPGADFTGELEARGSNIPFDENLLAALQEKPREVVRALNPGGTFDFVFRSKRDDPARLASQSLIVTLNRASVRYEKFPYPISNIRGTLVMTDNHWTFRDLDGNNGPGHIQCQGYLNPVAGGSELFLEFRGQSLPLQEEMRDALSPQAQRTWNQLKPQGAINLAAEVRYLSATRKPEIRFRAEPVDETTSIEPAVFPYRLEKLHGAITFREGHLDIEHLRAIHDRTPVEVDGYCDFDHDGNWHLRFDRLTVDRLRVDRDLIAALSGRLKKTVVELNPTGAVSIAGMIEFFGTATPGQPIRSGWNATLDLHEGTLGNGCRLENINGDVRLIGECDGQHVSSRGLVAIDSLTFKGYQFTQVQGPIWFDDKQVVFGSAAERPQPGQPPHRITARLYDGFLQTDGRLTLGEPSVFSMQALLSDANLKRFAHENFPGKQKLDGKVLASINLHGMSTGVHSLSGVGQIRFTKADIYELPFMVALLKILSVKPPDATAFTDSAIDYRIEGDHVYLDKIAFNGDAVSLEGSGEMGFDSGVNLTFHGLVGRSDWQIPVVKSVMGAASRQLMQIHVTGTLADPKMTRDVLPVVEKAIEEFQTNVQQALEGPPPYPQARGIPMPWDR